MSRMSEDDESMYSVSQLKTELSASELKQTEINPEEIMQKIDLLGTTDWNSTD